jgi:ATP-dependent protease HslVU (ClpYQ) peptidase subunit
MTCIVAVTDGTRVLIGGDSAAVGERELHLRATRKVFRTGPYLIGFTRSWRMGQILRHVTRLPAPPETREAEALEDFMVRELVPAVRAAFKEHGFGKTARATIGMDLVEEGQELSGDFLVGLAGQIFEIRADYQVTRSITAHAAVGSGAIVALGALHALSTDRELSLQARARTALEAAELYTPSVRGPFHFVEEEEL